MDNFASMSVLGLACVAFHDVQFDTIRTVACKRLIIPKPDSTMRCQHCKGYQKTLCALLSRHQSKAHSSDGTEPSSHTNYHYLANEEKDKRLHQLHHQHRLDQRRIDCMRGLLDQAIEERGIVVDEELHHDYHTIMQEKALSMSKELPPGSFAQIFWETQLQAATVKDARSMRWDPIMIRWCLYLRHLSGGAYDMIRDAAVVKLPSQRDYTYVPYPSFNRIL
jgi:hypothetical protein